MRWLHGRVACTIALITGFGRRILVVAHHLQPHTIVTIQPEESETDEEAKIISEVAELLS